MTRLCAVVVLLCAVAACTPDKTPATPSPSPADTAHAEAVCYFTVKAQPSPPSFTAASKLPGCSVLSGMVVEQIVSRVDTGK